MSGLHADTVEVLRAWTTQDPQQNALRHAFLALLDSSEKACFRAYEPGHVTASAVLVDHTAENVLLTLHPRVGQWLQVGGHCEPEDDTLSAAALREATEESGVAGLHIDPEPVHLEVHPITCSLGLPTRHFDVRFLVRAPEGAQPTVSDESLDLRWWSLDALAESDLAPLMANARDRLTHGRVGG